MNVLLFDGDHAVVRPYGASLWERPMLRILCVENFLDMLKTGIRRAGVPTDSIPELLGKD